MGLERLTRLARPMPLLLIALALRFSALLLPQFFSGDEAIYSALAVRLLNGFHMYTGAVDHKPLGVTLTYAGIFAVAGRNHIVAVRAVLILVVWATGLALARTARTLTGWHEAPVAGLFYVCASSAGQPRDALAANTELFLNLPLALAAVLVAQCLAQRVRSKPDTAGDRTGTESPGRADAGHYGWLLAAGVLTGIAGLYKYQAALAGVAWAIAIAWDDPRSMRTLTRLAVLAAGFGVVAASLCAYFYLRGDWDAFVFWGWRYNFSYINALTPAEKARSFVLSTGWEALFWSALVALAAAAAWARRLTPLTVCWLIASCVAVSVGGRFFRFYYVMALPPLALASAAGAKRLAERRSFWGWSIAAAGLVSVAISFALPWTWRWIQPGFQREHETFVAVGRYIKAHSSADERVFVWGNASQIYYFADRVMATRFAFCNYHVGKIWGSWSWDVDAGDTSQFVVPRAWTELLEDLDRSPPAIVVDAAAGRLANFDRHPISRYPQLARRLARSYRLEATVSGVPIYRRIGP